MVRNTMKLYIGLLLALLIVGLASSQKESPITFRDGQEDPQYANPDAYGYRYCAYWKLADGTAIHSTCDPYKFMRCGKYLDYEYQCCPGFDTVDYSIFEGYNGNTRMKCARVRPQWNFCPQVLIQFPGHYVLGSQMLFGQFLNPEPMDTISIFAPNSNNEKLLMDTFGRHLNKRNDNSILYHVVKGRIYADDMKNGMILTSVYKDYKLKVTTYSYGVICIECVELTMADVECKNGLIHFIRKPLIPPSGIEGIKRNSLLDLLTSDSRTSEFAKSLSADLKTKLGNAESKQWYTVIVPDNDSWKALSSKYSAQEMEVIASNHVLEGMYCSAGLIRNTGRMTTMSGDFISIDCTTIGQYEVQFITDSCGNVREVVRTDLMAPNGVAHLLNGTLVPMTVRNTANVLNECYDRLGIRMWSNFLDGCDLMTKEGKKYAFLMPVDYAFNWWSNYTQFQSEYQRFLTDKNYRCRVARYHVMEYNDDLESPTLMGQQQRAYDTNNPDRLFETNYFLKDRYHSDLYFHYSRVIGFEAMKTKDGVMYRLSKINVIPEKRIIDIINEHPKLTTVKQQVNEYDMDNKVYKKNDPHNLFLAAVDESWKDNGGNPVADLKFLQGKNLGKYLLLHHIPMYLWGDDIGYYKKGTTHRFMSSAGIELIFYMDENGVMKIGYDGLDESKWATVVKFNLHAKDGIVWLIKPFLACPNELCPKIKFDIDYFDVYVTSCMIMEMGGKNQKPIYKSRPLEVTKQFPEYCVSYKQATYKSTKIIPIESG